MTAIRHFPNTPLRHAAASGRWHNPAWLLSAWHAMERYGYRRAALELELQAKHRAGSDPVMAQQFAETAAACRLAALPQTPRSTS